MFEPLGFKTTEERIPTRTISKKVMATIIREVIKEMGVNIILQESSLSFTKKSLKEVLKKHDYKIYSFFLDLDEKDVAKRDKQRDKPTMGLGKWVKKGIFRELRHAKVEKGDIVINTSKHSIKQVVDIILKEVGEKRKKHPNLKALRKSW
jgi:RNase adaptor protein for sRNA GlmZ degradation